MWVLDSRRVEKDALFGDRELFFQSESKWKKRNLGSDVPVQTFLSFFKYTKYLMCQPQLNEGDTVDKNQFLKNLGKVR